MAPAQILSQIILLSATNYGPRDIAARMRVDFGVDLKREDIVRILKKIEAGGEDGRGGRLLTALLDLLLDPLGPERAADASSMHRFGPAAVLVWLHLQDPGPDDETLQKVRKLLRLGRLESKQAEMAAMWIAKSQRGCRALIIRITRSLASLNVEGHGFLKALGMKPPRVRQGLTRPLEKEFGIGFQFRRAS